MKRVAVNGMGRIGRLVVRSLIGCEDVELVAVNDIASMETIAYLLAHSTEYGALGISVSFDEDMGILHVGDKADRKSTRLNSSHSRASRMPSSA